MATYWVAKDGNNGNALTRANAKTTIQAAVDLATTAGDIVQICSGTYAEKVSSAANGTSAAPIKIMAYGNEVVVITGADPTAVEDVTCLDITHDYIHIQSMSLMDHNYDYYDTNWPHTGSWNQYYWGHIGGSYVSMSQCRLSASGDIRDIYYVDETNSTKWLNNRLLLIDGDYAVVEDSYFRGGSEGVIIAGAFPRRYVLQRNIFEEQLWNCIVESGDYRAAQETTYTEGLIQYNTFGKTYGEDNIQMQRDYDANPNSVPDSWEEGYEDALNGYKCVHRGIIIRGNRFVGPAGENVLDLKASGPTICIEDNLIAGSWGSDDGGLGTMADNDQGGPGIEVGTGDVTKYAIVRNNLIGNNHSGIHQNLGYHVFNNTFFNNGQSYRGENSTNGNYFAALTDGVYSDILTGMKKVFINNICYNENPSSNSSRAMLKFRNALGSLELDNNIYYEPGASCKFITNETSSPYADILKTTLTSWQTELEDSNYDSWLGRPTSSRAEVHSQEINPGFINVPTDTGVYSSAWNFGLTATSPATGSGAALTTAVGAAAGGSSTTLVVRDSYFFHDGYGIDDWYVPNDPNRAATIGADYIKIGAGAIVQISSINYSTDTITLAAARDWNNDDEVFLCRSREGSVQIIDDIGYHDYGNTATEEIIGEYTDVNVDWDDVSHVIYITEDTNLIMTNVQRRDIMVVIKNANGYEVKWTGVDLWFSNAPATHPQGTHWFTFMYDNLDLKVYGLEHK